MNPLRDREADALCDAAHDAFMAFWRVMDTKPGGRTLGGLLCGPGALRAAVAPVRAGTNGATIVKKTPPAHHQGRYAARSFAIAVSGIAWIAVWRRFKRITVSSMLIVM